MLEHEKFLQEEAALIREERWVLIAMVAAAVLLLAVNFAGIGIHLHPSQSGYGLLGEWKPNERMLAVVEVAWIISLVIAIIPPLPPRAWPRGFYVLGSFLASRLVTVLFESQGEQLCLLGFTVMIMTPALNLWLWSSRFKPQPGEPLSKAYRRHWQLNLETVAVSGILSLAMVLL